MSRSTLLLHTRKYYPLRRFIPKLASHEYLVIKRRLVPFVLFRGLDLVDEVLCSVENIAACHPLHG